MSTPQFIASQEQIIRLLKGVLRIWQGLLDGQKKRLKEEENDQNGDRKADL